MDKKEKKKLRQQIGQYLDISNTRLKDEEALQLKEYLDNFDSDYKGQGDYHRSSYDGWCSDGKYTRTEESSYTFNEDRSVHVENRYHDDDGQHDESEYDTKDGRSVLGYLNQFKRRKR